MKETNFNEKKKNGKKLLWTLLFALIAVISVWAVTEQSSSFSFKEFGKFLSGLNVGYVLLAIGSMLLFILFEALAIRSISTSFGYKRSIIKNCTYSASDIYFSSITPSATGGQPASAYFMVTDGIPVSAVTIILLVNLIMYTFAIVFLGLFCFIVDPIIFLNFSTFSKILIIIGCVLQILIAFFFIMLLRYEKILYCIGNFFLTVLHKFKIVRKIDQKRERLYNFIETYKGYVHQIKDKRWMLFRAFIWNFLQRASLVFVSVFSYLAAGGSVEHILDILVIQSMVVLGSNMIPIPGAMGVVDYLMLDGYDEMMTSSFVVNFELLSRSVSFYFCVIICGLIFLLRLVLQNFKKKDL